MSNWQIRLTVYFVVAILAVVIAFALPATVPWSGFVLGVVGAIIVTNKTGSAF